METKIVKTNEEGVFTVYRGEDLVAVIKRDEASRKTITYLTKEACAEDIINLINNK